MLDRKRVCLDLSPERGMQYFQHNTWAFFSSVNPLARSDLRRSPEGNTPPCRESRIARDKSDRSLARATSRGKKDAKMFHSHPENPVAPCRWRTGFCIFVAPGDLYWQRPASGAQPRNRQHNQTHNIRKASVLFGGSEFVRFTEDLCAFKVAGFRHVEMVFQLPGDAPIWVLSHLNLPLIFLPVMPSYTFR